MDEQRIAPGRESSDEVGIGIERRSPPAARMPCPNMQVDRPATIPGMLNSRREFASPLPIPGLPRMPHSLVNTKKRRISEMKEPPPEERDEEGETKMSYRMLQQACRAKNLSAAGDSETLRERLVNWERFDDWMKHKELSKKQKINVTDDIVCNITLELPVDPVTAEDGRVYEREAIEEHFRSHIGVLKSPVTNMPMGTNLLPSTQSKSHIETLIKSGVVGGDQAKKWLATHKMLENRLARKRLLEEAETSGEKAHKAGQCYQKGLLGLKVDLELAFNWFYRAHIMKSVKGTAQYGYFLCEGLGECRMDRVIGMAHLGHASAQGSNFAAYAIGRSLLFGDYGSKNIAEAMVWLRAALAPCQHDHLHACNKDEVKGWLREHCSEVAPTARHRGGARNSS